MPTLHPITGPILCLGLAACASGAGAAEGLPPPAPLGPIFPAVAASGAVDVTLVTSAAAAGERTICFGMPFPRGFVTDPSQVRLETAAGQEVACDVVELARWRHLGDPALDGTSIRSVLVTLRRDCDASVSYPYVIRWGAARTADAGLGITPATVHTTWGPQAPPLAGEHPATDGYARDGAAPVVAEPYAFAALPAAWLMNCNLRGPVSPITDGHMADRLLGFHRTYVNDTDADVTAYAADGRGLIDFASNYEIWLFDRPFAIWNLYVQTGSAAWLRHAHRASQYYASWIAVDASHPPFAPGAFMKKAPAWSTDPGDAKYSHGGGLLAAYLLSGDGRLLDRIRAFPTLADRTVQFRLYPFDHTSGLYTERHLAAGLSAHLAAFEATGEAAYRTRIAEIIDGMQADVDTPPPGYPADMQGVLLHRMEVHEGGSQAGLWMSPWMSALLCDVFMRYHLVSGDDRALAFMASYARFVADRGIYYGSDIKLHVPWYMAGTEGGDTDNGEFDDFNHGPDVLGLLARGRWAAARLGRSTAAIDTAIANLRPTCTAALDDAYRSTAGLPRYRNSPGRRTGWWFGTNGSLAWFGVDGTAGPGLAGVSVSPLDGTTAEVTWTTVEAADRQVDYGPTPAYGSATARSIDLANIHRVVLEGLSPGATYHVRATSRGAGGGTGSSIDIAFTTPDETATDTTPPTLTAVLVGSVTTSGAVVSWATDEAADQAVEFGLTTAYGTTVAGATGLGTERSVALVGLAAGTTYHVRARSRDAAGNLGLSSGVAFTTAAGSDTAPPVIAGLTAIAVGAGSVRVAWTTDEAADAVVEYGTSTAYGQATVRTAVLATVHQAELAGLAPGTVHHLRVLCRDAAGNEAVSGDLVVTTLAADGGGGLSGGACGGGAAGLLLLAGLLVGARLRRT